MTEEVAVEEVQPVSKDKQMKRQVYKCRCGNVSVAENYLPDEQPLPCLPCGKCHAGQGMDSATQLYKQCGLLAVGSAELYTL